MTYQNSLLLLSIIVQPTNSINLTFDTPPLPF